MSDEDKAIEAFTEMAMKSLKNETENSLAACAFKVIPGRNTIPKTVMIYIKDIYGEIAKLSSIPDYETAALSLAGEGNAVILTGAGPVWLYLRLAHALHGKAISLYYTSPVSGLVEVFNHNPF